MSYLLGGFVFLAVFGVLLSVVGYLRMRFEEISMESDDD